MPVAAQSAVTAIAAGYAHNVALKADGSVVAWGRGDYGETTVPVAAQSGVIAIAAGGGYCDLDGCYGYTVALKNDGTVVMWGSLDQTTVPTGLSGVTAIAAGGLHTVALIGTGLLLPSLSVKPSGTELILSWLTNAVGFTLQSTLNLTPPVTWIDSTQSPAVIGVQFTVTGTASDSARFYRLRKP